MNIFNLIFSISWLVIGVVLHRDNPAAMISCFIMSELLWQRNAQISKS